MSKHQRPLWIVPAIVLLLAVGAAGCSRHDDPAVATANSGAPDAGAGAAGDGETSLLRFSQCMRDQGLTWYPDPQPDGGLVVHNPDGVDQGKLAKAEEACKRYYPGGSQRGPIPAEDLAKIRQVSQCMRDHGFANYPDPDANGSITIDSKVLGVEPDDPAFQRARQECDKYLPAPKRSKGTS
ncbi:hypothetical protein ABZS66_59140 [Dactylosporangium sp. NPDC005572]|uniref:hypothetical protein n=1 Tax=Dactylosporangium sp. NPDC005572 TaxID=3156889 RepID=UPI0033B0F00D